ncbi:hypothetical protein VTI74DRAFT_932 [Chaetomium olivicolor]
MRRAAPEIVREAINAAIATTQETAPDVVEKIRASEGRVIHEVVDAVASRIRTVVIAEFNLRERFNIAARAVIFILDVNVVAMCWFCRVVQKMLGKTDLRHLTAAQTWLTDVGATQPNVRGIRDWTTS